MGSALVRNVVLHPTNLEPLEIPPYHYLAIIIGIFHVLEVTYSRVGRYSIIIPRDALFNAIACAMVCELTYKCKKIESSPRLYRQRSLRGRFPFRPPRRYTWPASKVALCLLLEGGAGPFSVPAAVTELHIFFLKQNAVEIILSDPLYQRKIAVRESFITAWQALLKHW